MPLALAICTTADPTAPAAAETKTMSPSLALRRLEQPEIGGAAGQAEIAEKGLRFDARDGGKFVEAGAGRDRLVAPAAHVQHHVARREAGSRLSTTSPTAPPSIGSSSWNGGT